LDWTIDWHRATEEERWEYSEAVLLYTPPRFGYVWDKGWRKILGMDEVNMHHIAALAQDVWGDRCNGHEVPCKQDRRGKPKGKWRKRKDKHLKCSNAYWHMNFSTETGRRIVTRDANSREGKVLNGD